jgi:hypothetical protein
MNVSALLAEIDDEQRARSAALEAVKSDIVSGRHKTVMEVSAAINRACESRLAPRLQEAWLRKEGR